MEKLEPSKTCFKCLKPIETSTKALLNSEVHIPFDTRLKIKELIHNKGLCEQCLKELLKLSETKN